MGKEVASAPTFDKRIPVSVFEHTAAVHADRVAISQGNRDMTFAELARHVERIADVLRNSGVRRDVVVATCFESGAEYIATMLAVMKTAGIFMPIDLRLPPARLAQILDLTTPALAVGSPAGIAALPARGFGLATVGDDFDVRVSGARTVAPRGDTPDPDDASYIMFTSGSTGRPKAILGCTKSLGHFVHWEAREFGFDASLRVSQFAPLTFDASLRDILLPLTVGGCLCIPPRDVRGNASLLVDWLEQEGVTLVHCVPSLFRLLTSEVESRGGGDTVLPRLRHILMAGEAVYGSDVLRWMDLIGTRCELVNLYGPSETTLVKTFHRIAERPAKKSIVSIGKPMPNTAVLVVKGNRLCEIGETGDIYINTPFASKGYYRDPERTAEAFVPNPLAPESGERVYKTGDLGRYLPDRSLEFVGRLDTQVKVNGIRIELGEVQGALASLPAIEQAVVQAIANADQENRLVCYYTEKHATNPQAIRAHLETTLPEYMIPSFYVRMERFPLTVTGKVDRKALPKPEELLYAQASYEPPSGDIEERIAAIWGDVLSLAKVGANNRFTELGGNSLRAIRVISRMFRAFGVELTIPTFFEHATVRKLGALVGQAGASQAYAPIPRTDRREHDELSHMQQRLWILGQIDEGLTAYNNTHAALIEGPLDRAALRRAFEAMLQRHESLRTAFVTIDDKPRQVVLHDASLSFVEIHLRAAVDRDALERDLRGEIAAASKARFDLARGPLVRVHLFRLPDSDAGQRHVLVFVVHHIVADGWSMGVLERELSTLYRAFRSGGADPLPPLRIQYRDFCAWQRGRLDADAARIDRDYWLRQLSGDIEPLDLPADHPRPAVFTFTGRTRRFELGAALTSRLKQVAERADATLFMVLVAAVKVLLYRYTGRRDLIVGTPIAGRGQADLEDQVGFYAGTLVLRDRVAPERSFAQTLADVRRTCLDAYQHQSYPFDRLIGELRLDRDASRNPLFDVMVVMQDGQGGEVDLEGLSVSALDGEEAFSRFDVTFNFQETRGQLHLDLNYNDALFDDGRIVRMAGHLTQLCESLAADPEARIDRLHILPADERQRLDRFSRTAPATTESRTLSELFEAQVPRTPDRPAIVWGAATLTYRELNERAGQLAAVLQSGRNVRRGDIVGVSMARSEWSVIALLAILKAQAVYLPVDPQLPAARVLHMLEDSRCRTVLIDGGDAPPWSRAATPATAVLVDVRSSGKDAAQSVERSADDPAYVIYTSGSTGLPKGVVVTHRAFVNMIEAQRAGFGVTERDRVLQFFSTSFDGSLSEIFMALLSGAALVIADTATILDPERFAKCLRDHAVTVATLSPSYLHRLERGSIDTLETLITAGEPAIYEDSKAQARVRRTFNAYGPTETAVCASYHQVAAGADAYDRDVPIGRPLPGLEILVLQGERSIAPIGVPGEICVSGVGLAAGYLNRPELTAERFTPHPFRAGERLYRSGDRGCWRHDGTLKFSGRLDDQVKVAGRRVECGEIEQCLLQISGIREASVFLRETGAGAQLVGCVAGVDTARLSDVRAQLRAALPDYMVPASLIAIDRLPLTAGGKVDKRALAAHVSRSEAAEISAAPRTDVERQLIEVWTRVLGRPGLGIDDDFFGAGGTSLAAIEAAAAMRRQFGVTSAVLDLYRAPTIRELAERLERSRKSEDDRRAIVYNQRASRTLFCFPPVADADGLIYGRLAAALPSWRICAVPFVGSDGDIAASNADLIQNLQPHGPYALLGYSAGGSLVFAAARELERRGLHVADLILLDTYYRDRVEPLTAGARQEIIDQQIESAAVLRSLGDDASRRRLMGRIDAYLDYLVFGVDEGVIDADIHLLRAESGLSDPEAHKWQQATRGRFCQYQGAGSHDVMLDERHLPDNARLIADLLDPRA